MKYVILIHSNPQPVGPPDPISPPRAGRCRRSSTSEMDREFEALLAEISASGELVTAEALADPASATLYGWSPERHAAPPTGPYAEAKEQLAGFFLIDCDSRQRAEEIAAQFAQPGRHRRAPAGDVARRRRPVSSAAAFEDVWRRCAPHVLAALVRRYGDFDAAEDAVQEALLAAARQWPTTACRTTRGAG